MRRILITFSCVALCVALATPAYAQMARAGLEGRVVDPDGAALPGVAVTMLNEKTGQTRTTVTNADGRFVINGLSPDTYTLTFELTGFRTEEQNGMRLLIGQKPTFNVAMALGGVAETVTVTGEAPIVETTSKQVGGNITEEMFTTLPTQGRSFVMFAALLPGVIGSPSSESTASDSLFINGQDDNNNSFNIDGADNSDDVIGARAGAQTRTAIEAIQEFQIITTQFDAEFGRTQGGVLNAITKSGGNTIRGSGFYYYQDDSLNKSNFFNRRNNTPSADTRTTSRGGTVGGPFIKNKLFTFFSIERTKPNQGVSRSFSTRSDKNFTTTESNLLQNWLLKFDWQATSNHKLAVRFLREYSPQLNQIIGATTTLEASREEADRDTSFVGTIDSVIGDSGFNNLRISNTREDVSFANPGFNGNGGDFAAQRNQAVSEDRPNILLGANTVAQSRINDSVQVDDTFSFYSGDHDVRVGVQWSRRREEFSNFGTANGQFTFDTDVAFDASDLSLFPVSFSTRCCAETTASIPSNKVFGAFIQDNWKPIENLTLNLGIRYDRETITPNDDDNFSPRVGFSWDPSGKGTTVIRGGFGRFFERYQLGFFAGNFLDAISGTGGFVSRIPDSGSDQQLFKDIADANGFTTLQEVADFLITGLEGGGAPLNLRPTVQNFARNNAHADTLSIGIEHSLSRDISVSADFIHTENEDIVVQFDANPFSTAQGGRPNISIYQGQQLSGFGSITTDGNFGDSTYNGLQLSARRRFTDSPIGRIQARISYTYSMQEGNAPAGRAGTTFQSRTETGYNFDTGQLIGAAPSLNLDNPANKDQPSAWQRNHNLVMNWSWYVPGTGSSSSSGLLFSGVFRYMSGSRFTPLLFARLDNNNRAPAPAGTFPAGQQSDIAQGAVTTDGTINDASRPDFSRLDLTLRYRFRVKNIGAITAIFDVFNVLDRTNFNGATTFVESAGFRIPSSSQIPREVQLGVRIDF